MVNDEADYVRYGSVNVADNDSSTFPGVKLSAMHYNTPD